jgi:hypothetical protein
VHTKTHPFDTRPGGHVGQPLERLYEGRAAIRIARVINGVHADEQVARIDDFGVAQRNGQEHRVARGHVGRGNARTRLLRHGDGGIGQRRAPDRRQVDADHAPLDGAERRGNAFCSGQFGPMTLPVIE